MSCLDPSLLSDPMADFEACPYSKREVVEAGRYMAQTIWEPTAEVIQAFAVVYAWRSSCALPLHRIRHELRGKIARAGGTGVTAGRLKRLQSIRSKLRRQNRTLYQLQDIAGVRAILPSMSDVERVQGYFCNGDTPHSVVRIDDYISTPKPDGYRSRHIILKFSGVDEEAKFNRHFVEVQLRTRMQHAWATAVEAVGLVRRENLKAGKGSAEWLRFFVLMSKEMSLREGQPEELPPSKDRRLRLEELRELNEKLNALKTLESYNQAIKFAGDIYASAYTKYLINFFPESNTVVVKPYTGFTEGTRDYNSSSFSGSAPDSNAVLVEVDKARDLKAAYPNYYLDVTLFAQQCRLSISEAGPGSGSAIDVMDTSWLSHWRRKPSGR